MPTFQEAGQECHETTEPEGAQRDCVSIGQVQRTDHLLGNTYLSLHVYVPKTQQPQRADSVREVPAGSGRWHPEVTVLLQLA